MSTFLLSYRIELSKLLSRKKYIVFIVIGVVICFIRVCTGWISSLISGGAFELKLSNMALEMLPFFAEIFIPLIVFMAVSDLFSSEFHDNTIKAMLLRPVTRFKLMISKSLACFSVGAAVFIAIYLASTVFEAVFGSRERLGDYMLMNLGAYLLDLVPVFVLVLMSVLVNIICKTPTLSMFVCFLTYAVMKYCNYFVPSVNNILFTSYNQWHKLWIGAAIPARAMSSKIFLIIGSVIIFLTAAYYLFDKKDI